MGWYDVFARFYDASVERLYVDAREQAAEALDVSEGLRVLDLPVGTGQSLPALTRRGGVVTGVDLSTGMLERARRRGLAAELIAADVGRIELDGQFDRVHTFLGMSVFPDPELAFARLWAALRPGGRMVVVDVHAERPTLNGRMVGLVARADVTRRTWEPLERVAADFERRVLDDDPRHGGALFLATGLKP